MSGHKILIPCLLELDRHYQPKQRDSIWGLLAHLKDISQIFINCLTNTEIKRAEEKKPEDEVKDVGQPQPFFGEQPQNDVSNAWKIINKPIKYSNKQHMGFTSKEFLAQPVLTANNPDLIPNMGGPVFGGYPGQPVPKAAPKEDKKVDKKPKPSVFTVKVTKEEKKPVEDKETKTEEKKESSDKTKKVENYLKASKTSKSKMALAKKKSKMGPELTPQEKE